MIQYPVINRRVSKRIMVGNIPVGGTAPISVQSMTNTPTKDVERTLSQIEALLNEGCEIVRLSIPDEASLYAFKTIRNKIEAPLIADIHFDYKLAIKALEVGADAVRINPGNIGTKERVIKIIDAAKANDASIRIGVNSGSIERDLLDKYGYPTYDAMVESMMRHVRLFEENDFFSFKISLKASNIWTTYHAYKLAASKVDYPFHIGITEAGPMLRGTVKSAIGLSLLLLEGIGDTIRVSLTADPLEEVRVAWEILRNLGIRFRGPEIISCPTCARCKIDLFKLVERVENALKGITVPIKVAVMGCAVNGPGEAREADIGIAAGKGRGVIFKKGKVLCSVNEDKLLDAFMEEIKELIV